VNIGKRKETIDIENALHKLCKEKRIYGCEEAAIGFYNNGFGNEIVDFITMDGKGIIRCYEIKVTLQDLKSKAKKSWYGHYNYLVVSEDLYSKSDQWQDSIPNHVGIMKPYTDKRLGTTYSISVCRVKKQKIENESNIMLKESLVRSMYYKMQKYKDSSDVDRYNNLKKRAKEWENKYEAGRKERLRLHYLIKWFERA